MNSHTQPLLVELSTRGVSTTRELASALGVSQPTLSRALATLRARGLVRIGRGPATCYGLRRAFPPPDGPWPLHSIDETGRAHTIGTLHALMRGSWHLEQERPWASLRGGDFTQGLYPGFPWFLDDLRPQGFMGRAFARRFGPGFGAPADPRLWRDEHTVAGLLAHGEDLPGGLVLGDAALARAQATPSTPPVPEKRKVEAYSLAAQAMMQGEWPGSSAAGEQPKFTHAIRTSTGEIRKVIVKFSGDVRDPAQRRRADLLVAESIAATLLAQAGHPAARTAVIADGTRVFLESTRFDRVGDHGRRGLVSLFALDAAYYGELDSPWTRAASRLAADGILSSGDDGTLRFLWWFGTGIGNTDMHYGNVSLFLAPDFPLRLAPAYDMLPMAYHPASDGSLPTPKVSPPIPPPDQEAFAYPALALAREFWSRLSDDPRASAPFRRIAAGNGKALA